MLKMVLADDESIVRNGLLNIINWREYDIEIIAEASDGQETYDLCMELKPDILFTDIRMPFMDGIEVATKLKENGNALKVIIFSGIQDFGYAKSALNISAEGYILKPMDINELTEVVTKVVKKIKQEKNLDDKVQRLRQQLHENIGAAREKFLRNLVLGAYKKETEIIEKLNFFKNPIDINEPICVAVLQIDDYVKLIENSTEEEKQLLSFSVTNISEELINNYSKGICVVTGDNEQILLFNTCKDIVTDEANIFSEIVSNLQKYLGISVSIGIGRKADNLLDIYASYKDAVNALYFKFYTGKSSIINITDVSLTFENNELPNLYREENELINLVKSGNVEETKELLEGIFNRFGLDKKYKIEYIQRICEEFVYSTSRAIYELGENIEDIQKNQSEALKKIRHTESIIDLQEQLESFLLKIAEYFSSKYTQKNNRVINDIKKVISKRYMEDISINKIAESVYLSPNYISLIFKQETGETIIDYLTKTRMEEAKTLLRETDFKVLDISDMVGFQDASYFSKVFKKYTGIHPQKYRNIYNTGNAGSN